MTFISWAEHCSRSDNIARELKGSSHMVYWRRLGSRPLTVLLKYAGQTIRTLGILLRESPDAVFVMSPPVVAVLPVWLYSKLARVPYVIDAHSGAFLNRRWRHLQWLQYALCRHAATTIVTNNVLAERVRLKGGHVTLMRDVPVVFPAGAPFHVGDAFTVAVVCSFNYDEPVAEIFDAARQLPDVQFYVTGNPKHLRADLAARRPPNATLTGFLPEERYGALLTHAHAVLTLTTMDHTMLRGAYEAIYQTTPVIISDWRILRDAFPEGAIHVANDAASIRRAIEEMRHDYATHKQAAARLRETKLRMWETTKRELLARVGVRHPAIVST